MRPLVLIVEDNATHQKLIQLMCERFGCDALACANCQEAVEALAVSQSFTLVLMDLNLPDINGLDCVKIIRQMDMKWGTHTPVIAVTANAMTGDRERCLESGMDDYLSKPFSIEQFGEMLRKWLQSPTQDGKVVWMPAEWQRRANAR